MATLIVYLFSWIMSFTVLLFMLVSSQSNKSKVKLFEESYPPNFLALKNKQKTEKTSSKSTWKFVLVALSFFFQCTDLELNLER